MLAGDYERGISVVQESYMTEYMNVLREIPIVVSLQYQPEEPFRIKGSLR